MPSVEFSNNEPICPVLPSADNFGSSVGESRMVFTIDATAPLNRLNLYRLRCLDHYRDSRPPSRFGATKGLVSLLWRLFFTKHDSRRESAAVLPSNGTRNVAPSPLTSRTFAVRILSLRGRFVRAMVTPFVSADALASTDQEPATSVTGYAWPRSSRHLDDSRRRIRPS
jgi:hypothetical protein